MHAPYVELFHALHQYTGDLVNLDVLQPWLDQHGQERRWLTEFSKRSGSPIPAADQEELWRLYGLSRIAETLVLRFQPTGIDGGDWAGPDVTADEVVTFFEALGLHAAKVNNYSAFHHEIVEAFSAPAREEPPQIVRSLWPCLMLGSMLVIRGGVAVLAGSDVLVPEVANSSTLYWAHRRRHRPCEDLSHGWGSNSQWRTSFRRDYSMDGSLRLNVDGREDLSQGSRSADDRDGLTRDERIELLVHRHFVRTKKPHADLWPYDDRLDLQDPGR